MQEEKKVFCAFLCAYGCVYAFFHIMPTFLPAFLKRPLTWGDALDFLTPFFVIPVAYLLYFMAKRVLLSSYKLGRSQGVVAKVLLALGFLLYVDGHGLHLGANSIVRLIQNDKTSELFRAVYLYDEVLSHYMWHSGVFLVSVGLIVIAQNLPFESLKAAHHGLIFFGAAFYGFNYTVGGVEGQTVILTFPLAFLGSFLSFFLYLQEKKKGLQNPFLLFFWTAYLLSMLLFAYWGFTRSGFPQFSELGWIR